MTSRVDTTGSEHRSGRFDDMIKWYETVFDRRVQYRNPVLAFLTYDEEHHRVALINMEAVAPDAVGMGRGGPIAA